LKTKILAVSVITALLLSLLIPAVMAHAPLGTKDNESIGNATFIPDLTKSWALYSALNKDGDAQYYTFNVTAGQKIHTTLYKSMRAQDTDFHPRMIIMGPQITPQGSIPANITVPSGYGASLLNQTAPKPTFEPFSPSIFAGLADLTLDNPAPGKYYLVVFEQSDAPKGGNYGLTVGDRETYTVDEWILIPFNLINIYQWEGQSAILIFAPMITALVIGVIFVAWQLRKQGNLVNLMAWLGAIAGFTFIGTAATTLYQLASAATEVNVGSEAIITLVFAIIPLILGVLTLRLSLKNNPKVTVKKRVFYVVLGVVALFMWAGLIFGPIMSIAAGLAPSVKKKNLT
jgi:hypothetical protein